MAPSSPFRIGRQTSIYAARFREYEDLLREYAIRYGLEKSGGPRGDLMDAFLEELHGVDEPDWDYYDG